MNLLFISAELNPLRGETPLSHQVAELAGALCALGHRVTAVAPLGAPALVDRFSFARRLTPLTLSFPEKELSLHVYDGKLPSGVEVHLVGHETLFEEGEGAEETPLRHAALARAALQLAVEESGQPGDWHVIHGFSLSGALAPLFARDIAALSGAPTVLTVSDLENRGRCGREWVDRLGLSWDEFTPEGFEFYGELDLLKAGLVNADRLLFPGHSALAAACVEGGGGGLEGLLRARAGATAALLPALDFALWNPATDHHLPVRYDAAERSGKLSCKAHLQNKLGLPVNPKAIIFGLVPPLTELAKPLAGVLERVLRAEVQLVAPTDDLLDSALGEVTAELEKKHPRQVARCALDERGWHLLLGGADFVILDAPTEGGTDPLLAALRYGTLPVTRAEGLSRDLVVDLDGSLESGNGFLLHEAEAHEVLAVLQRACTACRAGDPFQATLDRAMSLRCSWEDRAHQLEQLYAELLPLSDGPSEE